MCPLNSAFLVFVLRKLNILKVVYIGCIDYGFGKKERVRNSRSLRRRVVK